MTYIYAVGSEEHKFIVDRIYLDPKKACDDCDTLNANNKSRGRPEWWVVYEVEPDSDFIYWTKYHSKDVRAFV